MSFLRVPREKEKYLRSGKIGRTAGYYTNCEFNRENKWQSSAETSREIGSLEGCVWLIPFVRGFWL
jgi:hypothetical protein